METAELAPFFAAVLAEDRAPIVLCNLNHIIIYMNPTAVARYAKRGGAALLGQSLLACHNEESGAIINRILAWFATDPSHNRVLEFRNAKENKDVYMIALRDADGTLIGYYEKHEYRSADEGELYAMPD